MSETITKIPVANLTKQKSVKRERVNGSSVFIVAALVLIVFAGCLGGGGGAGRGGGVGSIVSGHAISGRAYFFERSLYGGIPIFLRSASAANIWPSRKSYSSNLRDATGGIVASTRTDYKGNYFFQTLSPGIYNLYATTGDSEILFRKWIQVAANAPVAVPETALFHATWLQVDQVTSASFRLRFRTNKSAKASIMYGTSVEEPVIRNLGPSFSRDHQVTITGLSPSARYGISIYLTAEDGQEYYLPGIFTATTGAVGPTRLSVSINDGDFETDNTAVRLALSADGAEQMRIGSSENLSAVPWEPFSQVKVFSLDPNDGTKRVFAQFRDSSGNESSVVGDFILLSSDKSGYLGVWINDGNPLTSDTKVLLTLLFPRATQMRVSNRPDFLNSFWERFVERRRWELPAGDGEKTVYAQFNGGGADPSMTFRATIIHDTRGPEVSMRINNGALKTNSPNVELNFSSVTNPREMQVTNDGVFNDHVVWRNFETSYRWVLTPGDGEKKVYARFRDAVGNIFGPISSAITLAQTPPSGNTASLHRTGLISSPEVTSYPVASIPIYLHFSISDPSTRTVFWKVLGVVAPVPATSSMVSSPVADIIPIRLGSSDLPAEGLYRVYYRFQDGLGNITPIQFIPFELTRASFIPPSITLNNGDQTTRRSNLLVRVFDVGSYPTMWLSMDGNFQNTTQLATVDQTYFLNPPRAGAKTIYARFQHLDGSFAFSQRNITAVGPASAAISTSDTQPLNSNFVNLGLFAENAVGMILSENLASMSSTTDWVAYQTAKVFPLSFGGGTKTIYAKFRNSSTNYIESVPVTLQVQVNLAPPTGNTAAVRQSAFVSSPLVESTPVASLPVYLHFTINNQSTVSARYAIAASGLPMPGPASFTTRTVPITPVALGAADFPGNGVFHIYYTFADGVGNHTATRTLTIDVLGPKVIISPASAGPFRSGQTQQFSASILNTSGTIVWSINPAGPLLTYGSIDGSGRYSAPGTVTIATDVTIIAQLQGSPSVFDEVLIKLETQVEVHLDQTSHQISLNAVRHVPVVFRNSVLGGSVSVSPGSPSGGTVAISPAIGSGTDMIATLTYTAPSAVPSPNPVTVTVTSLEDATKTKNVSFQVNVGPWITVSPETANVRLRTGSRVIAANISSDTALVSWSIPPGGGSFDAAGILQTAISTPPSHVITYYAPATLSANPVRIVASFTEGILQYTATSVITLTPPVLLSIAPKNDSIALATSTGITFSRTVENATTTAVTWEYRNASATHWVSLNVTSSPNTGILSSSGGDAVFYPPAAFPAGQGIHVQVRATSNDDPTASDVATITLLEPILVILREGFNASGPVATSTDVTLEVGTRQFFAEIRNAKEGSNLTVRWFVENIEGGNSLYGTVLNGRYTAPDSKPQSFVTLRAVANQDPTKFAECRINLQNFWRPRSAGLKNVADATHSISKVLIDPTTATSAPRILYCGTNGYGVYRATVAVATLTPSVVYDWDAINWVGVAGLHTYSIGVGGQMIVNDLAMSRQNPDRVVAATSSGAYLITNSGANSGLIVVPNRPDFSGTGNYTATFTNVFSAVAIDPVDDTYMYLVGKNQGVLRFTWDHGSSTYVYNGTLYDDRQPYSIIRSFTDNYMVGTESRQVTRDGITDLPGSGTIQLNCIAMDPAGIVYVGFSNSLQSRSPDVFRNGYLKFNNPRAGHYLTIATTSHYPGAVDASTTATEPVLVNFPRKTVGGAYIYNFQEGIILSMAVDPNTPTTIWATRNDGVFRTTNDGSTWTSRANYTNVRSIFIDPVNTINVFVGTEQGLFRSRDAGATWKQIKTGLEGHSTINTLGLSPGSPGTRRIFLGTTGGVFMGATSLDLE